MKKKNCQKSLLLLLFLLVGICLSGAPAQAAGGKAVKVKSTRTYSNYMEQMTVRGVNKNGKTIWKYTTKRYNATELNSTQCVVHKNRVYVFEGSTLKVFKKSNGKKIWVRKNITPEGYVLTFDGQNNLYVIGYYDDTVYKISSKGKILWKTDISSTGNYWPYKLKCKNNKLFIYFEANTANWDATGTHLAKLSKKTGKLITYY